MVASRMVFAHRPDVVESAGVVVDRAGVAWDRLSGAAVADAGDGAEVFGPSGGAALYRRALLDDVGLFDESFFMYLEDVDLAWRARLAGWRCLYAPAARVVHQHSATAGADSAFKRRLLARNRVRLVAKNYPAPLLGLYLPAIIGYDVAVMAALAWPGAAPVRARLAAFRGRLDGLRGLGGAIRARRGVQRRRRVPVGRAWRDLAPIPSPFAAYRREARLRQLIRVISR
jgi:GT2 family glycosyltransferase